MAVSGGIWKYERKAVNVNAYPMVKPAFIRKTPACAKVRAAPENRCRDIRTSSIVMRHCTRMNTATRSASSEGNNLYRASETFIVRVERCRYDLVIRAWFRGKHRAGRSFRLVQAFFSHMAPLCYNLSFLFQSSCGIVCLS